MTKPEEIRAVQDAMVAPGEDFVKECWAQWKGTQPQQAPRLLYHYCTAETFRSIASSGVVWASDIRFMNDASEITYASDLLKSVIENKTKEIDSADERELVRRIIGTFDLRDLLQVFAFCCSELDDSIPQWTAYGGRRGGFAVGFDLRGYVLQAHDQSGNPIPISWSSPVKVIYDPELQLKLASNVVARLLPMYRAAREKFAEPLWTFVMARICEMARRGLSNFLLTFKQPGFQHEKEWRLVFAQDKWNSVPQYNVRSIGLVPYVPIKLTHAAGVFWGKVPIRSVTQGPTSEPELALEALRAFIRHLDLPHTEVAASKMPLRF